MAMPIEMQYPVSEGLLRLEREERRSRGLARISRAGVDLEVHAGYRRLRVFYEL